MADEKRILDDGNDNEYLVFGRRLSGRHPHKSVFSRFCECGANVTMGLMTDADYVDAEENWKVAHSGTGHAVVSRHDWLMQKLQRVA